MDKYSQRFDRWGIVVGLQIALISIYLVPFGRIPGSTLALGSLAAGLFAVPVFFAGLLFAREFRSTPTPSAALDANMLGAVVGGLMENLSLVIGLKALLLIAALFYLIAGIGLRSASISESTVFNSTREREPDTVPNSV